MMDELTGRNGGKSNVVAIFATTRWSVVVRAGEGDAPDSSRALETLCRDYWRPLFEFSRRLGNSPEDAQDLTQGFFQQLLASSSVARADRERGRFRTFLLSSFRNFMKEQYRGASALKRGGGALHQSLDTMPEDAMMSSADAARDPEYEYERAWAFTLLERVLDALGNEYQLAGRDTLFAAIRPLLTDTSAAGYRALGESLGMSESAVTVAIHRMRKRYGALLRNAIADTVADAAEVDDELRHLIKIVSANPGFSHLG